MNNIIIQYRNLFSALLRESQTFYLKKYFQKQLNDLKSYKNIKDKKAPPTITDNGQSLTKPKETVNTFRRFLSTLLVTFDLLLNILITIFMIFPST